MPKKLSPAKVSAKPARPVAPLLAGARRAGLLLLMGFMFLQVGLLPWQWRNARILGAPVMTSDGGRSLWLGNNAQTFSVYPTHSIDRAEERAWIALPEETRARVRDLSDDELAQDAWFRAQALDFIRANPAAAFIGGCRKAWATFSPWFNPGGARVKQWAHLLSYGPVALLALAALIHLRSRWRDMLPFVVIIGALVIQSAIFFGHSGYRAYVDPFLIILAASWFAVDDTRLRDGSPS